MTCPTEAVLAAYADDALGAEAQELSIHLADCAACQARLEGLRAENSALIIALRTPVGVPVAPQWTPAPHVRPRELARNAALAIGAVMLVHWRLAPPPGFGWAFPTLLSPALLELRHPRALLAFIACLAGVAAVAATAGWIGLRRSWRGAAMLLLLLAAAVPGHALTRRSAAGLLLVPATETFDDTLLAAGDTVRVEGTITGDLIAFARRVEIRGTIRGNVLAFAESIDATGRIDGNVFSFARTLEIGGPVARSVYGWAETIGVGAGGRIGAELLAAGGAVAISGEVAHGVICGAGALMVRGRVGRTVSFFGDRLDIEAPAHVDGGVSAHVGKRDRVHVAASSAPAGIDIEEDSDRLSNRWWYTRKLLALAAVLLTACLWQRLAPDSLEDAAGAVARWWRSLAIGAAAVVLTPIAAVAAAVTLVGLPVAAGLAFVFVAAIYVAKIPIGEFIGRVLLPGRAPLLQLVCGLAMIAIAVELPVGIGGAAWLVVTLVGLGAITATLGRMARRRRSLV